MALPSFLDYLSGAVPSTYAPPNPQFGSVFPTGDISQFVASSMPGGLSQSGAASSGPASGQPSPADYGYFAGEAPFAARFGTSYQNPFAPTPMNGETSFASPGGSNVNQSSLQNIDPNIAKYANLIQQVSNQVGVPAQDLAAIMKIESRGQADATSPQGAEGLMQVMPFHFHSGQNGYDPLTNITVGAQVFKNALQRYGNPQSAAAAYFGAVDANGNPTGATDAGGQTGTGYVAQFNQALQQLGPAFSQALSNAVQNVGQYVFPLPGWAGSINNHWGNPSATGGTDLLAPRGTPIYSVAPGTVTFSGYDPTGGNAVQIHGNDGRDYYYAHMDQAPLVQAGQTLGQGTTLGKVGNTGDAAGGPTHLHIGIGYGINTGADAFGGLGNNFNAVNFLQQLYGGS